MIRLSAVQYIGLGQSVEGVSLQMVRHASQCAGRAYVRCKRLRLSLHDAPPARFNASCLHVISVCQVSGSCLGRFRWMDIDIWTAAGCVESLTMERKYIVDIKRWGG